MKKKIAILGSTGSIGTSTLDVIRKDKKTTSKFFLFFILFAGVRELLSVFKKRSIILFLVLILILSLFSIYYLKIDSIASTTLLYLVITICISSDIGGYVFG